MTPEHKAFLARMRREAAYEPVDDDKVFLLRLHDEACVERDAWHRYYNALARRMGPLQAVGPSALDAASTQGRER